MSKVKFWSLPVISVAALLAIGLFLFLLDGGEGAGQIAPLAASQPTSGLPAPTGNRTDGLQSPQDELVRKDQGPRMEPGLSGAGLNQPRTNRDVVEDWYGDGLGEVIALLKEKGFDESQLDKASVLAPEGEVRLSMENILLYGSENVDEDYPYAKVDKKLQRRFDPNPLESQGVGVIEQWNSSGKLIGVAEVKAIEGIVEKYEESMREAFLPYRDSHIAWRERLSQQAGAYYLSPLFDDPRIDYRSASEGISGSTYGLVGNGWSYVIYWNEGADPIHGPVYDHIYALYEQRYLEIHSFIDSL